MVHIIYGYHHHVCPHHFRDVLWTASGNILEQEQCVRLILALYSCVKILYTLIPNTIQKYRLPLLFDLLKYQLAIVLKDLILNIGGLQTSLVEKNKFWFHFCSVTKSSQPNTSFSKKMRKLTERNDCSVKVHTSINLLSRNVFFLELPYFCWMNTWE